MVCLQFALTWAHYCRISTPQNLRLSIYVWAKLLKQQGYAPRLLATDKLRSYSVAQQECMRPSEHSTHRWANNRIENSHQPTRHRERWTRQLKSPGAAQRFLAVQGVIYAFFWPGQHLYPAPIYRKVLRQQFTGWHVLT
ncbi:MAG: IS6 family transposase [Abitibacteriaceae bacterium]|nr:IS6 family transposase [Abditibacteriaceae bacterium]